MSSGRFLLKHLMVIKLKLDELALDEQPLYIMVELADFRGIHFVSVMLKESGADTHHQKTASCLSSAARAALSARLLPPMSFGAI